jgi:chaperonin GroES
MAIQATNDFVFVIRGKSESEKSGIIIPDQGREKPNEGTIVTIGDLVQDKRIKGALKKKCLFFKGTGFTVPYQGVEYLVLTSNQIIAIL